ncbi:MAG TPA: UDP-3-O-(3-hydroxymyristoyl)glucosamine N-acyltransferase [Prolixibacteraceae bacterium]|nr:UDP-3-O-(3-hydroxymyristoyl)glucosamine N-acyltransferase [Prolixibacteraceae bacterium]
MDFKVKDIAAYLNGEVVGSGDAKISNVTKIEEGKPGTLSFLSNPKYENYIYSTQATAVIVNASFQPKKEVSTILIKVQNAYQAFASLLEMYVQAKANLKKGIEQPSFKDETAAVGNDLYIGAFSYIGKNAKIGNNVKLFPHTYVGDNVIIGDDSVLFAGSKIYDDTKIGKRCIIHAGAVLGSDGFGFAPQEDNRYKKIPQIGNVVIEDDVEIGANTTIDCGTMGSTILRKGVKIDNLVQIAHNCEIGENTVIAAQTGLAGTTKVGRNCKFGGQVGLAGHLTIGNNVNIGAQSGVSKSVNDNETILLSPAFNIKDAIKSSIIFKNLPKLQTDIRQLQKDIENIKNNTPASSK